MSNYRQLKNAIKEIRMRQIITSIIMVLYSGSLYILILKIQEIIDKLTNADLGGIDAQEIAEVAFLLIFIAVSSYLSQYLLNQLPIQAKNIFVGKMYKKLLEKPNSFFEKYDNSKLYSLLTNDAVSFSNLAATYPVVMAYQSITLLLCVFLLVYTQWLIAIVLIVFVSVCFVLTDYLSKRIAKSNKDIFLKKEQMTKQILEGLENHKVIEIFKKNIIFFTKFNSFLSKKLQKAELKQSLYHSQYMTIYILLTVILPFFSILLGLYFVSMNMMAIGQALTVYALASQLQEPIRQIAEVRTNRDSIIQLAERLSIFLEAENSLHKKTINKLETIKMQGLDFSYHNSQKILDNINLDVYPKLENTLIKGQTGCGKSTLIKLIMHFHSVSNGALLVNGINIDEVDMSSYYQNVLYVDQKPAIFYDSLKNNVLLYDNYSDEEVKEVVDVCQLGAFYASNCDSIIDDKTISGGQAQRISIARALLRKPKLLLLDEPTSALDKKTSIQFSEELKIYCEKYEIALLIVSHKEDIMSICENQIIVKDGKLSTIISKCG